MPNPEPTSRREFLQGRAAVRALIDKTRSVADALWSSNASSPADGTLRSGDGSIGDGTADSVAGGLAAARLCVSRRAMACEFSVEFHATDGGAGNEAALAALDRIERLEEQLSVYRNQSETLDVNARAAFQPVEVEAGFFELLQTAQWVAEETQGAFDVTSGPLSKAWGFFRRAGSLPSESQIDDARRRIGFRHVVLDSAKKSVSFAQPDVEIHFNSIGKGYALDQGAEAVALGGLRDCLLQGGQSSVLARGVQRDAGVDGWRVGIPNPLEPRGRLGEIVLRNQALGTSGSAVQHFDLQGVRYGHVIDPRTGWPAQGTLLATAVAPSAALADALSTAFYVMGPQETAEYCRRHPDHGAILVCPGSAAQSLVVQAFNMPAWQWLPATDLH